MSTTNENRIIGEYCLSRITARLPRAEARMLAAYRGRTGASTSAALRDGIRRLAAETGSAAELADLCDLLGLPPDASPDAILAAVQHLVNPGAPPPDAGATAENADPAPPKQLTKAERDYCTRNKLTPAQFQARKRAAVKRAPTARKASR